MATIIYPHVTEEYDDCQHEYQEWATQPNVINYGMLSVTSLNGAAILVTGGSGTLGNALVKYILNNFNPRKIVIYSRGEFAQSQMRAKYPDGPGDQMRYLIGDVRDLDRLTRAMSDIDLVIHAAALKQVVACEYNPIEAIRTNALGAQNVILAAIQSPTVEKVIAISSDKAVEPVNLYGMTKGCAEKLITAASVYCPRGRPLFANVRYGNILGSRGSVVELFQRLSPEGNLPITDKRMTRFWWTAHQAAEFICERLADMQGGETFVPRMPSFSIADLAAVICPTCTIEEIGIRPGEKLHEMLISRNETNVWYCGKYYYIIGPAKKPFPEAELTYPGFYYDSVNNSEWWTHDEMKKLIEEAM